MLAAMTNTTLGDDVFRDDEATIDLERHMATRAKQEAALFVVSGTMGNQIALRSLLDQSPPHSVLCDRRSHIRRWEAGGVASLSGASVDGIEPRNGRYMTFEEMEEHVVGGEDVHTAPTAVISLENTLDGSIQPLAEVERIAEFARAKGIKLHLDGARLWEAVAASGDELAAFTALFDSVSLCFCKGLGAPIGSVVVGGGPVIERARRVRKSIGGGLRQAGVLTAAARVAVEETFGSMSNGADGKLPATHRRADRIGRIWCSLGGRLDKPVETNMVWLDLRSAGILDDVLVRAADDAGLRLMGPRLVVHHRTSSLLVLPPRSGGGKKVMPLQYRTDDEERDLRRSRRPSRGGDATTSDISVEEAD